MSLLCIVAGAAIATLALPHDQFTLAWTHSVEKLRWEEDYRVGPEGLTLEIARIRGSGAGMEPPADAVRGSDGWWVYRPKLGPLPEVALAASDFTADYEICIEKSCQPLAAVIKADDRGVRLRACKN